MPHERATWNIDPVHSSVDFELQHLAVSTWRSRFGKVGGTLSFAEDGRGTGEVDVQIAPQSVVAEPVLHQKLQDGEFFDSANHPVIHFRAQGVEVGQAKSFKAKGELTIRGVTRPVVLEVEQLGFANNPFSKQRTVAFRARTMLSRSEFGLKWNAVLDSGAAYLGEQVQVSMVIEAALAA